MRESLGGKPKGAMKVNVDLIDRYGIRSVYGPCGAP